MKAGGIRRYRAQMPSRIGKAIFTTSRFAVRLGQESDRVPQDQIRRGFSVRSVAFLCCVSLLAPPRSDAVWLSEQGSRFLWIQLPGAALGGALGAGDRHWESGGLWGVGCRVRDPGLATVLL